MGFNEKRHICPSSYFAGVDPNSAGSIIVPAELGEDDFLVYNLKSIEYMGKGIDITKNPPRSVLWDCMGHFVLGHDLFYTDNEVEEQLRFDFSLMADDSLRLPRSFERWLFREVLIPLVNAQYSEKK